ncbi:MAG: glycosyltransferase [Gaiellaceae bacterium]
MPHLDAPPAVSVVVPSRGRALRLRWLLNALEEQTLPREEWEAVVVHDYDAATAARIIESHPLHSAGVLRHVATEPRARGLGGRQNIGRQRNTGWREARAELVAFTDDDCRPAPEWLELLVRRARCSPGAVVQGATRPEPFEAEVSRAPHARILEVKPVTWFAQTGNILYPRALLDQLGGFDERTLSAEDVELWARARAAGGTMVPEPRAVVFHAIESHTLPGSVRRKLHRRDVPYVLSRHPELRTNLTLRLFLTDDHLRITAALLGLAGARARPWLAALAVPYAIRLSRRRGGGPKARVMALAEAPGQGVREAADLLTLAAGSVRHRTVVL